MSKIDTRNISDVFQAISRQFPAIAVSTAKGLEKFEIERVSGATIITTMKVTLHYRNRLLCAVYSTHFFRGDQPFFTLTSHGKSHLQGRNADQQIWAARVRQDALSHVRNNRNDGFSLEHFVDHIIPIFGGAGEFYEKIADAATAKAIRKQTARRAGLAKRSEAAVQAAS